MNKKIKIIALILILTIIIYPIIQLTGYDIEEEYKGSKILTKYFYKISRWRIG